jgi:hypothetical protein
MPALFRSAISIFALRQPVGHPRRATSAAKFGSTLQCVRRSLGQHSSAAIRPNACGFKAGSEPGNGPPVSDGMAFNVG